MKQRGVAELGLVRVGVGSGLWLGGEVQKHASETRSHMTSFGDNDKTWHHSEV
jgi:hypothetical protein